MSRFAVIAATSQTLSIAAMEEASRLGQREADLDHLLLALTLSTHPAGQVLRACGITLDGVRRAVTEHRAEELRAIGISTAAAPEPGRIDYHETGGYEWSPRCRELFVRASSRGRSGDAEAVLRELLNEPSGLVDALLQRMGASSAALLERLDEVADLTLHHPDLREAGDVTGHSEAFVPASPAEIWALLIDPTRTPDWDGLTARVDVPEGTDGSVAGASWVSFTPERRPDGRPLNRRPRFRRRQVEVLAAEVDSTITWRFAYPDAPRSTPIRVTIALAPAAGGTQLDMRLAWTRSRGWRGIVGWSTRPLQRLAIWLQLSQMSAGISRVFR